MARRRIPLPKDQSVLRPPAEKLSVKLSEREWRAVAAVMHVAGGIATNDVHATLLIRLRDEIINQTGIEISPIEESN